MKLLGAVALAALALAAAVPTAQAQSAPTGITLVCTDLATPIPFSGSSAVSCTATVGCLEIVTGGAAMDVTFSVTDPPAWLSSAGVTAPIDPQACLTGGGSAPVTASVPVTVTKDAPGVEEHTISFVATVGQTASAPAPAVVTVEYNWDYGITTDASFPLTVTKAVTTFNMTATQSSNARSMIMMEQKKETCGILTGLTSTVYESAAGKPDSKTFKVTFTAPTGEWTSCKVTFMGFGHYLLLDSRSGEYDAGVPVEWTFTNGGVEPTEDEGGGDKDSPAPVGALMALGLVALAAFVRRQK